MVLSLLAVIIKPWPWRIFIVVICDFMSTKKAIGVRLKKKGQKKSQNSISEMCMLTWNQIYMYIHVHVYSAWNSFWKCPAEILGQNNIWPSSCEFSSEKASLMNLHCTHLWLTRYRSNLLGHDCSWLIINFTMRLLMSLPIFCFIIRKFVQ